MRYAPPFAYAAVAARSWAYGGGKRQEDGPKNCLGVLKPEHGGPSPLPTLIRPPGHDREHRTIFAGLPTVGKR